MTSVWDIVRSDQYVGLRPWAWVQFESLEPPGPFPFLGGVDPQIAATLSEVHRHLAGAIDIAISDVFAGRASAGDPALRVRIENAYAEAVHARPHWRERIRCGREPDGTFHWDFPIAPGRSAVMRYSRLRLFNAIARRIVPLDMEPSMAPAVGTFVGCLDGTLTLAGIRGELLKLRAAFGQELGLLLNGLMEELHAHDCLAASPRSTVRERWLSATQDGDLVHLGHAALLYRRGDHFLLFDPWLMPWYAETPIPSLWTSLLPKPAAIFLTHDHDDHVDPRTLLAFPKDIPVIVPSRLNRRALYYDYQALLTGLGFTRVVELAHGDAWSCGGADVVAVPFYGECSCELGMPRNCYLIADRGRNTLIHVDSGPTNSGENAVKDGVVSGLVRRFGPIQVVCAQPGQLLELRTFAAYACLSHPGRWLEVGENCCVSSEYLAQLTATAGARVLFGYANGGADWLPDHPVFVFSRRNQALRELVTAHWWPVQSLVTQLAPQGCRYHLSRAGDLVRTDQDGIPQVLPAAAPTPGQLYDFDHSHDRPSGNRSFAESIPSPGT
jgi:hypothetical protein